MFTSLPPPFDDENPPYSCSPPRPAHKCALNLGSGLSDFELDDEVFDKIAAHTQIRSEHELCHRFFTSLINGSVRIFVATANPKPYISQICEEPTQTPTIIIEGPYACFIITNPNHRNCSRNGTSGMHDVSGGNPPVQPSRPWGVLAPLSLDSARLAFS
jgi:hypothetical protein